MKINVTMGMKFQIPKITFVIDTSSYLRPKFKYSKLLNSKMSSILKRKFIEEAQSLADKANEIITPTKTKYKLTGDDESNIVLNSY